MKNFNRYIALILLFFSCTNSYGQVFGNEWIDYNQSYYSFKIVNSGIHKLDYNTLSAAGIPLNTFQSANIQIFGKEREVPLYIQDNGDNSMDAGDFILFYAERNDGWLDSTLYLDPETIGNPAYSLYNDTIEYFFTWNNSTSNLRYAIETDVNFNNYSSIENFILYTHEFNYNNGYQEGVRSSQYSSSFYMPGEGWGTGSYNGVPGGYNLAISANTPAPYTGSGAPNAIFKGLSSSGSNSIFSGTGNHHLQWTIGSSNLVLLDTVFIGYHQMKVNKTIPATILGNGTTAVNWRIINDQGAETDFQAINYYSITYGRTTNFLGQSNFNFRVINNPQGKIRIDATNVGAANPMLFVLGDTPKIVPFVSFGSGRSALIPNSSNGVNQKVIYIDSSQIISVSQVSAVSPTARFTDFLSLPQGIENALLFIYHPKLEASSNLYQAHRTSAAGGNYNVIMANVNELYRQFGGGIEKHINGIRRFSNYIYSNSSVKPVGLYLMGKGIREAEYNATLSDGPGARKNAVRFHESLIPSFGQPSSDVCITANLGGSTPWAPLIPTGRISARSNAELEDYLNKIIAYDANQNQNDIYDTPNKDWQKQILHFAGGSNLEEQVRFKNWMNNYKLVIEDSLFGGNVQSVFKQNSNPLDPTILSSVTDRIEQGVSLMSYFGHSSSTNSGFEINLDEPTNWNNTGKYPLMLVNSCYNGNIFQLAPSKSEDFVQVANYGAIGYIASVSVGYDVYLNQYSHNFYELLSRDNYGATIGSQMMNNINELYATGINNSFLETTCTQMVLNGDPMVRLNWHQRPEIELLEQNVSFFPTDLNLTVDSIEVQIILTNLGHSTLAPFNVEVTRNFPSSPVDSVYNFQISTLHYKDTLKFKVPLQPNIAVGINTFNIRADLPTAIDEQYDEVNNNQIVKTLFINIDGIIPVVPYDFAVVPDDSVTVRASTVDPIAPFNSYRFELDTTDLFNSPMHRYAIVSGLGGVKEVNPSQWLSVSSDLPAPLTCTDSAVYFWRVAIDSSVLDWRERSFQYIENKTGWGQDHFFQFKKNNFYGIDYDRPNRERDFGLFSRLVTCDVYSSPAVPDIYNNAWYIDGDQQDYGILNYTPKLHVGVIDPITLEAWGTRFLSTNENLDHNFGNNNDNFFRSMKYFTFHQDDVTKLEAFQNMVNNEVPDGHYILIYSPLETRYDYWNTLDSTDMYNTFAGLGSDSIHGNRINTPFAFFCKKGDPTSVIELFADGIPGEVHLSAMAFGSDEGQESTPLIGPSSKWGNVYWKQDPAEMSAGDSTVLSISTYNIAKVFQSKIDMVFTSNDSLIDLNSVVDAAQYPYINLQAHYADYATNTPAQIDRWHVLFDPLPEAAIDGTNAYFWSASSDTLTEGQTVDFAIDVRNIYSLDMDSILINYWIEDENQVKHVIPYPRQDSLRVGEVIRDTIQFSTVGLGGINSLWVEVNPYVNGSLYITDQPEQEHFNNLLQIPFYVNADDKNPILDVTFNGNHILNGDIIDPTSEILITLKDDNEFLIMDNVSDTALFGVYLTYPSGNIKRIPFVDGLGNTVMQWIPAEAQNKRFKIVWPSEFEQDGKYTLMVQGTDRSGNVSGDIEYRVTFEIIHESSITHMMNYPNPFSTSTRFVFTLTGSEEPDDILIQILTVTGRVVKEINEDELGPIHIGRNITEYAWDGTDEYGDPLANGVYLYRVKAKINGEDIKHRESGADSHFKKDFGKMYLMR